MRGVAPCEAEVAASDTEASEDPDRAGSTPESPRALTFSHGDLADVWMLATQSVVAVRERRDEPVREDDATPIDDDEIDERVTLDDVTTTFVTNLYRPGHLDARPRPAPLRLERRTIVLIAGFVLLAVLAVGAGIGVRHLGSHGDAAAAPPAESQPDPDAFVTQLRCEALDSLAYFVGSLSNHAKEPLRYRVDVEFDGRDGQPVGHGTQTLDFVLPSGTSSLDVSAAVTGEVASCTTKAIRLSRDG